jgi:hypothetical protein
MMRLARPVAFLGIALLVSGPLRSEEPGAEPSEKQKLAETLVQRAEAANERPFDARYRAIVVQALAALSDEELAARAERSPALGPLAIGESGAQLVYTPLPPCRLIDTRLAGGSLAAGIPRNFRVIGSNLSSQGGSATGCGIPDPGPATAAIINFVAVNPVGAGNLRAWAYSTPQVGPPNASILNYAAVPGLNIANGIAVPICDPAQSGPCPDDLRVQADISNTHLVADVVGYFERFRKEEARSFSILGSASANATTVNSLCGNVASAQVVVTPPVAGRVVIRANVRVGIGHTVGTPDSMMLVIATSLGSCPSSSVSRSALPANAADGIYVGTVPIAATFDLPTPGVPTTYYVNALMEPGSGIGDDVGIVPLIEATFHPN